jgi:hypothetical protein
MHRNKKACTLQDTTESREWHVTQFRETLPAMKAEENTVRTQAATIHAPDATDTGNTTLSFDEQCSTSYAARSHRMTVIHRPLVMTPQCG